ncbi:hypothetical protein QNA08_09550 [Chelatococcus sp. SYSU_G07232]|uniref:Uncharacterized protein n=1 Tax=Chelatococcus albus TaxID=3047466 RepID=A0ABT7AGH2_9HYPH|nr:hypothetical protein [Chelatococcus sp. SYSU_G07232]MDJ1158478.1 hypothetical protein [Chelatococcus sp. SYSU_G07232]
MSGDEAGAGQPRDRRRSRVCATVGVLLVVVLLGLVGITLAASGVTVRCRSAFALIRC